MRVIHGVGVGLLVLTLGIARTQDMASKDPIKRDEASLIVSFVLLNRSNILNDIYSGGGEFLDSLMSELSKMHGIELGDDFLLLLKHKADTLSAYDFAMWLVKWRA